MSVLALDQNLLSSPAAPLAAQPADQQGFTVHLTPSPLAHTDAEAAQGSIKLAAVPDIAAPSADAMLHLTQGQGLYRQLPDTSFA